MGRMKDFYDSLTPDQRINSDLATSWLIARGVTIPKDDDDDNIIPTPEETLAAELALRGVECPPDGKRLTAYGVEEFLARTIPPRPMLLAPFLPTAGLAMLYAMRGIGKTHVALGIAAAVASGGAFLRWQAPSAQRVVYVDGEMPAQAMQARLKALAIAPEHSHNLRTITPDFQCGSMPDIATADGQEMIEEQLEDAALLIVDNLSTLCRKVKENESDSWEPVQEWALRLRQRGISLLIVHHAGRNGQARGTSRREDILDSVLSLKRPENYQPHEGCRFELHYEKARGFFGHDASPFEARLEMHHGKQRWVMRDLAASPRETARALVAQGLSQAEVARRLGVTRQAIHKWIDPIDND